MSKTEIKSIKVLNIAQPNAHNVIFGGKNVENRSSPTNIRGTIAIYASKTYSKDRFDTQQNSSVSKEECAFGKIVGFVDLVDCISETEVTDSTRKWFVGAYGYILSNVRALQNPIAVTPPKGAVTWWPLEGTDFTACISQIESSSITPITTAEKDPSKPKAKTGAKTRLIPSENLAAIIGDEPVSYKQSIMKLFDYLNDNELIGSIDGEDAIIADKKLEKLFGQKEILFDAVKDHIMNNLKMSE